MRGIPTIQYHPDDNDRLIESQTTGNLEVVIKPSLPSNVLTLSGESEIVIYPTVQNNCVHTFPHHHSAYEFCILACIFILIIEWFPLGLLALFALPLSKIYRCTHCGSVRQKKHGRYWFFVIFQALQCCFIIVVFITICVVITNNTKPKLSHVTNSTYNAITFETASSAKFHKVTSSIPATLFSSTSTRIETSTESTTAGDMSTSSSSINETLFYPNDYCYPRTNGTICVRLSMRHRTWFSASYSCKSIGGSLASVPDIETNIGLQELVKQSISGPLEYWIGLHDIMSEESHEWTDGTNATFLIWGPGEPNNFEEEDCVSLRHSGKWNDNDCSGQFKYLCQFFDY